MGVISLIGRFSGGVPDPAWNGGGYQLVQPTTPTDQLVLSFIAVQSDGAVVTVGSRAPPSSGKSQLYVTRFTPAGSFDPDFGKNGYVTLPEADPADPTAAVGFALQPERILVAYQLGSAAKLLRVWR